MYCTHCSHANGPGAKFCADCGSPMAVPAAAPGLPFPAISPAPTSQPLRPPPEPVASSPAEPLSLASAEQVFAGFWRRATALVLDQLILFIPAVLIAVALEKKEELSNLVLIIIWWLYKASMESSGYQATLGKRAVGIKVTDEYGERISFLRATGRHFASFFSAILLGIGFLMAGLTKKRQALHDMMASTLVVSARAKPPAIREGWGTMPMTAGVWAAVILLVILPFGGGILAAIAIPAYQDYVTRSKVTEAIADGSRFQARAMSEFWGWEQGARNSKDSRRDLESSSAYVQRIYLDKSQRAIFIELDPTAMGHSVSAGNYIALQGDSNGAWTCAAKGVANKFLPASCRQ
jgi:uncharacterized RDD family membrane protein YckC/Tfp pilus assembly protein PilE